MALVANPPAVRQTSLSSLPFTEIDGDESLAAREAMEEEHGYGPSAIEVDGQFAGWGGLQPEQGEADFGLALAPRLWGTGLPSMRSSCAAPSLSTTRPR